MRDHPLNPMRDSDLVSLLAPQTTRPVARIDKPPRDWSGHVGHVILDAVSEEDLDALAACVPAGALTAGSAAFGAAVGARLLPAGGVLTPPTPAPSGPGVALCGSASITSRQQVEVFAERGPTRFLDVVQIATDPGIVDQAGQWALQQTRARPEQPVLIAVAADEAAVARAQSVLGPAAAAAAAESALSRIARYLFDHGVHRLVVAGGETSGAVVTALGLHEGRVGPSIAPGVPWIVAGDVAVAFKSGNFGGPRFFTDAFETLTVTGEWA